MRSLTIDVMAGERARLIRETPHVPVLIHDPTDPRCGSAFGLSTLGASRRPVNDPLVREPFARDPMDPRVGGAA